MSASGTSPAQPAWSSEELYWARELHGFSETPDEIDVSIEVDPSTAPHRYERSLQRGTAEWLGPMAARTLADRFVLVLTAVYAVFARRSSCEDIAIGVPPWSPSLRVRHPEVLLPLRLCIPLGCSLTAARDRVRRTLIAAYAHEDAAVAQLRTSPAPGPLTRFRTLRVACADPLHGAVSGDRAELLIGVVEAGPGLALRIDHRRLDPDAARRLCGHVERALHALRELPSQPIGSMDLLDPEERVALLAMSRGPRATYALEGGVHRAIESRLRRAGERVVARGAVRQLGGRRLAADSNRIARLLRSLGVGTGAFVPILMERDVGLALAALSILKARGAFLPIDTELPDGRVRQMLQDSGARVVVVDSSGWAVLRRAMPADGEVLRVVALDDGVLAEAEAGRRPGLELLSAKEWMAQADAEVEGRCDVRDPCYLMYTSGSTGAPKAAIVTHEGALNHMWAERDLLELREPRILQTAPSSSDMMVWQLLTPLLLDGCTVFASRETISDPAALWQILHAERISVLELIPGMLSALLDWIDHAERREPGNFEAKLPHLKRAMVSGEAVPARLVRRWLDRFPTIPLVNAYGPTEAADDVLQLELLEAPAGSSVALGTPLPNMSVYIVDSHLDLCPRGVTGEIYVGGAGVGLGYWKRPALTAERFVPDPFSGERGSRMYRTGDRGWWSSCGVEFVGRTDHQVKVRGVRVELGEVEATLAAHPKVADAVAVLRAQGSKPAVLAAAVLPSEPGTLTEAELAAFARTRLAPASVPSQWAIVSAIPRTPNGKVDAARVRELLAVDRSVARAAQADSGLERAVLEAWCSVLERRDVGVEDNFLDVGGHSLLLVQLQREIAARCGETLPVLDFFRFPTVRSQAGRLQGVIAHEPTPVTKATRSAAVDRIHELRRRVATARKTTSED